MADIRFAVIVLPVKTAVVVTVYAPGERYGCFEKQFRGKVEISAPVWRCPDKPICLFSVFHR
ncbi:MAG: hypothetical protein DSY90_00390 [Deltaproteobacteria bacterium]|nr:MAG: hypothetical protein DSY90_00390 [Deltaproteobacteria bacterium]